MTPEAQRIAIAKACGWTQPEQGLWKDPQGKEWQVMHGWQTYKDGTDILPDYLTVLNAMHAAEKLLPLDQIIYYNTELRRLTDKKHKTSFYVYHATAAKRAEAYLRTIGKWEASK